MKRRLFEDLVVSVAGGRARGGLALPVSMTLHAAGVAALLALPAFTTEALPDPPQRTIYDPIVLATVQIAPPPPPPPVGRRPAGGGPRRPGPAVAARPVVSITPPTGDPVPTHNEDEELPPDARFCFNCEGTPPIGNPALPVGSPSGDDTGGSTGPIRVGRLVRPPTKLRDARPIYPDIARQARVQGAVVIACIIAPDGRVDEVQVVSGHPLLQEAALDAVRQWRYTPSLLNGVPVPVIMTVTVNFILH
jgi:periplasmic protein TonB